MSCTRRPHYGPRPIRPAPTRARPGRRRRHPAHMGLTGCLWAVIVASWISAALLMLRFAQLSRRDREAAG